MELEIIDRAISLQIDLEVNIKEKYFPDFKGNEYYDYAFVYKGKIKYFN